MKFSLVNGQRQQAKPNLFGKCPICDQATVARCGEVKIWHWAHKGRRTCDPWWENETEWHRAWKGQFPEGWQEVVHQADSGEKHIADVKTDQGWVIEFQHSYIKPDERRSRDDFYSKLIWVVNGARLERGYKQFRKALDHGRAIGWKFGLYPIGIDPDECEIVRDRMRSNARVFIDFGVESKLWFLTGTPGGGAVVADYSRSEFIEIYRDGATQKAHELEEFVNSIRKPASKPASEVEPLPSIQVLTQIGQQLRMYTNKRSRRL